jgi:hypothetical protein
MGDVPVARAPLVPTPPGEDHSLAGPRHMCCRESEPDAAGWRAYLDGDGQAVTFCPECAEREFGWRAESFGAGCIGR